MRQHDDPYLAPKARDVREYILRVGVWVEELYFSSDIRQKLKVSLRVTL